MGRLISRRLRLAASALILAATLSAAPGVSVDAFAADSNASANLVSQVAAHLAQAKSVRAQFTQTQTMAALKQPLVSSGSLLLVRDRGVIWRIETPYKTTYVITDSGVTQLDAAGHRVGKPNSANGARGVAQVSKMMRAMLGGDLSALYSQFDVSADGTPAQWNMTLTPNQPQIAQSIKGLQMSGGEQLQHIRIALANGDVTQIDFTRSPEPAEAGAAERTLLGAP
ncbi:outer membrane lipoprotein carrier protein LolA [Paraburkholderia sp.]|uniref:LolA family protein n=1 Tax=Paraburkholderia sp. TaxID=1926495 RepID=UPI00238D9E4E|nr:outer membrane lipoprotein carrier protein LolA [Paraburkholderia sp.]MDE1183539.1 outer membrane lipoprotein carrier protein LolA [Paraburkholderia sp.]